MSTTTRGSPRPIKWIVALVLGGFLLVRGVLGLAGFLETRKPAVQVFLGAAAIVVSLLLFRARRADESRRAREEREESGR
jgi:uncharacterized membrane protein HdeD (DUF308 family)